jgi:hypothetical protein
LSSSTQTRTRPRTRTRTIVTATIVAVTIVAVSVGCSGTKHPGSPAGSAGTGTGSGTGSTSTVGGTAAVGTGNGAGGGAGNGNGNGSTGAGSQRTTVPIPTTTAPSAPNWLKAHAAELRALKTAVNSVDAAFQANDDAAKTTALIECANAAAPLARSAGGSLPAAQADAITTISDTCAAMTHALRSGDTAGVDAGKLQFDKAVVVVTPLLP